MKKIIIIVTTTILIATIVFAVLNYKKEPVVEPYTPPVSESSTTTLQKILPYKGKTFEISWNVSTNQAEAIIYSPYPDSASDLVDWLADNNANNLPKNTVKIIRK